LDGKNMNTKEYIVDRALHWISALLLLFMLLNMASIIHNVDYKIKGQVEHRQDAIELHATVGVFLIFCLITRIIWVKLNKTRIPRTQMKTKRHVLFVKVTHFFMFCLPFLLVASGIAMALNSNIPLSILGFDISANIEGYRAFFHVAHNAHLNLIAAIWWLIAIHFVGILISKR
jgi:cytochrome b561